MLGCCCCEDSCRKAGPHTQMRSRRSLPLAQMAHRYQPVCGILRPADVAASAARAARRLNLPPSLREGSRFAPR
eukprot:4850663-Prymnesium_polylepis.2